MAGRSTRSTRWWNGFAKKDGIDEEEAIEWIEYNTIRAIPYAGEKAPIVMYDLPVMEEEKKDA